MRAPAPPAREDGPGQKTRVISPLKRVVIRAPTPRPGAVRGPKTPRS
jgi:hypothetical protein